MTLGSSPKMGTTPVASMWPVTTSAGPRRRDIISGLSRSVGVMSQPARRMALITTDSRALPASRTVRDSSGVGLVTSCSVAVYQRARRQLPTAEARISRVPSSPKRALGRE